MSRFARARPASAYTLVRPVMISSVTSVSSTDSSTGTDTTQSIGVVNTESSVSTDALVSLGIVSNDSSLGSENQILGIYSVDSCIETEGVPTLGLSNTDFSVGAEAFGVTAVLSQLDSSQESENIIVGINSADSFMGSESSGLSVPIASQDSIQESENLSLGLNDNDSLATTDTSVISVFSSSSETIQGSESTVVGVIDTDSCTISESANFTFALSSSDSVQGSENIGLGLTARDSSQSFDDPTLNVSDGDIGQETEVLVYPLVGIGTIDSVLTVEDQLGGRMAYKFVVSHFSSDVGIPSIIELASGVPELTFGPAAAFPVSDSDFSVATEVMPPIVAAILDTNTSVGAESSSINIIATDAITTADFASPTLFPVDSDHLSLSETQFVGSSFVSGSDSSVLSESQSIVLSFSSIDSVHGIETGNTIAEAASDEDSSLQSDSQNVIVSISDNDTSLVAESLSVINVHIFDSDFIAGLDNQPFFFNDSDSAQMQDTGEFSVSVDSSDSISGSETNFFSLQSELTMEWSVFAHMNQVVFAQPINQ